MVEVPENAVAVDCLKGLDFGTKHFGIIQDEYKRVTANQVRHPKRVIIPYTQNLEIDPATFP